MGVLGRFVIYGFAGWILEVVFTGLMSAVLHRDRLATARTYLWMHPIYGAAMLGLEWLGRHLAVLPWLVRAGVYVGVIYAVEFATGWTLRQLLGRCPWDYGSQGFNIKGLIRLDYAPAWYLAALLFEPFRLLVDLGFRSMALTAVLSAVVGGGTAS